MSKPKSGSSRPHKTPVERSKFYGRFIDESADGVFTCKYCKKVFPKGKDMPNYWTAHVDRCAACQEVIEAENQFVGSATQEVEMEAAASQEDEGATATAAKPLLAPSAALGSKAIPTITIDSASDEEFGAAIVAEVVAAAIPPVGRAPIQSPQQQRQQLLQHQVPSGAMVDTTAGKMSPRQDCPRPAVYPEGLTINITHHGLSGGTLNIYSPSTSSQNSPTSSRASSPELPSSRPTTPEAREAPQRASTTAPAALQKQQMAAASHHALMEAVASYLGDRGCDASASDDEARNQASGSTLAQREQQQGGAKAKVVEDLAMLARMQPQPPAPQVNDLIVLEIKINETMENYKLLVDVIRAESGLAEMDFGIYGFALIGVYLQHDEKTIFVTYNDNNVAEKSCRSLRKRADFSKFFQHAKITSKNKPPEDAVEIYLSTTL